MVWNLKKLFLHLNLVKWQICLVDNHSIRFMVISKKAFLILLLFSCIVGSSQEIANTKFGKGMLNVVAKDSSWSVKFAPRIQLLSVFRKAYDGNNYEKTQSNFMVRRARLKFSGFAFSPKLKYKLELGLSNRDIAGAPVYNNLTPRFILDAVVKRNFYRTFEL